MNAVICVAPVITIALTKALAGVLAAIAAAIRVIVFLLPVAFASRIVMASPVTLTARLSLVFASAFTVTALPRVPSALASSFKAV